MYKRKQVRQLITRLPTVWMTADFLRDRSLIFSGHPKTAYLSAVKASEHKSEAREEEYISPPKTNCITEVKALALLTYKKAQLKNKSSHEMMKMNVK